ncbi:MAG TPA: hypothetical protein VK623_00725 [Flavobacterium sp.]|nr:hypothetical protein [Flavobacterium sp.]
MKPNIQNLAMLSAVIAFASCESHTKKTITESGTEIVKARTPIEDTINRETIPPLETKTVEGTVTDINNGKDGYTAKLETKEKEIYAVTISHSNLKNHEQYKTVKIGDQLKVTGDYWKLENENQITVREIN